jgi:hypothetical protein
MAAYLVAGFALALEPRRWERVLGVVLIVLGTAMRYNAPAAVAPLCLVICGAWAFRSRLRAFGAAVALCLAIVGAAAALNAAISTAHTHPWVRTTAVWDIAGTLCRAERMSDAELDELLAGTGHIDTRDIQGKLCTVYTPRFYLDVTQGDGRYFADPPTQSEIAARKDAWWRVVREHPGAYLGHRINVMAEVLGLTRERVWEPVCQTVSPNEAHVAELHHDFTLSSVQYGLGRVFVKLGTTWVYRVWVYALLALILFGYALVRRDGFLLGVLGSGLLYELSLFVASPSVDFRYSHWLIACTCIAIAIVFRERYASGTASSTRPPGDLPR